jgi:hypothetical protein
MESVVSLASLQAKFPLPSFYITEMRISPSAASCVGGSSASLDCPLLLPHKGWLSSNSTTFSATFVASGFAVWSRNKPSSSHLYLQTGEFITLIIPLPPSFQQDTAWSLDFYNMETIFQTVMFHVTCNDFIWRNVAWVLIHNQYHMSTFSRKSLTNDASSRINSPTHKRTSSSE